MLEKVLRWAARYVKGDHSHDASVTDILNDLKWESLESCREQFSLIMLYNILKQNNYLPLDYRLLTRVLLTIFTVPTTN